MECTLIAGDKVTVIAASQEIRGKYPSLKVRNIFTANKVYTVRCVAVKCNIVSLQLIDGGEPGSWYVASSFRRVLPKTDEAVEKMRNLCLIARQLGITV